MCFACFSPDKSLDTSLPPGIMRKVSLVIFALLIFAIIPSDARPHYYGYRYGNKYGRYRYDNKLKYGGYGYYGLESELARFL